MTNDDDGDLGDSDSRYGYDYDDNKSMKIITPKTDDKNNDNPPPPPILPSLIAEGWISCPRKYH